MPWPAARARTDARPSTTPTHATGTLRLLDRALEQIVVDDDAVARPRRRRRRASAWPAVEPPASTRPSTSWPRRPSGWPTAPTASSSGDWAPDGPTVAGGGEVDALTVLWDAVDTAVADLKAAEATLREVRGRPV